MCCRVKSAPNCSPFSSFVSNKMTLAICRNLEQNGFCSKNSGAVFDCIINKMIFDSASRNVLEAVYTFYTYGQTEKDSLELRAVLSLLW